MNNTLRPPPIYPGDTVGIFTPSTPAYIYNEEKFVLGTKVLEDLGFKVLLGNLTEKRACEGYRPSCGKARAEEFMALYKNSEVKCLIATLGGMNSNSMIPYLDYDYIAKNPKVVCGFSDVTSLHLALLHYSKLRTFYGPTIMTWFSEYPDGERETIESFLSAVSSDTIYPRQIKPFKKWSNHFRDWSDGSWKTVARNWIENEGWKVLSEGKCEGEILALNLNTLSSACGTPYLPDFNNRVLLIEQMSAPFSREERLLTQLKLMGVFDKISGLLVGKPEMPDKEGAPFEFNDLIMEITGKRTYPIVSGIDISHTCPMHTISQLTKVRIMAKFNSNMTFEILEPMVEL